MGLARIRLVLSKLISGVTSELGNMLSIFGHSSRGAFSMRRSWGRCRHQ
jgi:hypothetical protein